MRVEYLYSGSKWAILEELAKKPQSTSELAQKLKTSQANISQQLKHLELAGIIQRKRAVRKHIHYTYAITNTYTHIVAIGPGIAQQKTAQQTSHEQLLAALYTHKHNIAFLTYILAHTELFNQSTAIGLLNREQPELLILAEHVLSFRENANVSVQTLIGDQRIAIWSHTQEEFISGIRNNEPYFMNLLQDATIAYDPTGELQKQLYGEQQT